MRNYNIAASELLQTNVPEKLFSGDLTTMRNEYRAFARIWHPDSNKSADATNVFTHVATLYEEAVRRSKAGLWEGEGELSVTDIRGFTHTINYQRSSACEVGQQYVGPTHLSYLISAKYQGFFINAQTKVENFKYANKKMQTDISQFLPANVVGHTITDGRLLFITPKAPELILLADIQRYYNDKVPPRHVAWILSRLYNIACYMQYAGIAHNNISPKTVFIIPKTHLGSLLGGWWFCQKIGLPLISVPNRTGMVLPWEVRTQKKANHLVDQELIRATGRELLGDIRGATLTNATVPPPMLTWLKSVARGSAIENYKQWHEVLVASFGARRFTPMELTAEDIY